MKTIQKQTVAMALSTIFLLMGCDKGGSSSTNGTAVDSSNLSSNTNGVFAYKNLEWQDNEAIKDGEEYAYRNDYCDALTLGGHYDWRIPSVAEFNELYEVRENLNYIWDISVDIYWTNEENSRAISVYNLNIGKSGLFLLDRIGSHKWGTRCVRNVKVEEK